MKRSVLIIVLLTEAAIALAGSLRSEDSLVVTRVFSFVECYSDSLPKGFTTNLYLKNLFQTQRRNFTLWVVPSMYALARGRRDFVSEQYGRLTFNGFDDYDIKRQALLTTVPHNRRPMPTLLEFVTPSLYATTLYGDHVLSPFRRENRVYYKYRVDSVAYDNVRISFRPRFVANTQLVKGSAIVSRSTGRILQTELNGEFDMIRFHTLTLQVRPGDDANMPLPYLSKTSVDFRFLGNHVNTRFEAMTGCDVTLPDTLDKRGDRVLMDSLRPYGLAPDELAIYEREFEKKKERRKDNSQEKKPSPKASSSRHVGWDDVGRSLIESLRTRGDNGYLRLSPIINPQYIGYSKSKGFSYRFKLGARYNFSRYASMTFNPRIGYNFRKATFYYNAPLSLNLWPRYRLHFDMLWANGNRIASSTVMDEIRQEHGDVPGLEEKRLDLFGDRYRRLSASMELTSWLGVELGMVDHVRRAVNVREMRRLGKPEEYRSKAPLASLRLRPWRKGPLLTVDYEQGLKNEYTNLSYERWELDAQMKCRLKRLQTLSIRLGGGFYTSRSGLHFMDYSNFRDESLPEGWDDDWTGNFQLLSSRLYNESDHYVRGNITFESPLMAASFVPLVGRYVERERIYISSLSLAHTRQYSELGYGFTCRFFSVGFFASFLCTHFQETGAKFTFELFRRW